MKRTRTGFIKNRRISITFRLTALYATILSLMILFLSFVNFKIVQYLVVETNKAELTRSSEDVAAYLLEGGDIGPRIMEKNNLNPNLQIRIIDNGVTRFQTETGLLSNNYAVNLDTHQVFSSGHDYVLLNKKVKVGKKELYVQMALDMETTSDFLGMMYQSLLGINILGVVFSILTGIWLTKRTLKPIGDITQTARNISINDLSQRIDTSGPNDELRELAVTINSMVDRLQSSIERQKQFISDASHELRTPISIIQGYTRMLERWGKRDPAVLDESIEALRAETDNMRKLFEQLLILAQADSGQLKPEYELFRLDPLIKDVVRDFKLLSPSHQIEIIGNPAVELFGDRSEVLQLLRIVMDNSVKYTPLPGRITLDIRVTDRWICMEVTDTGIGISPEDLPHVFERFYRSEKSRSKELGGTGLGLAIAQWIVESHGGKIRIESQPGTGTRIFIELPRQRRDAQNVVNETAENMVYNEQ